MDEGWNGRKLSIKRNGIQSRCTHSQQWSAARIVDRRGKRSRPPKKSNMFHDPKNLRPLSSQKGVPDIQHLSYGFIFVFPFFTGLCYCSMEFLLLSNLLFFCT